jgi:predicted dehydrogenase
MTNRKAVLVGLGNFGRTWYDLLKRDYPNIRPIIVDTQPEHGNLVPDDPFYTSFSEAVSAEKPDFVINVTPPAVHNEITHAAFDHGLPVLCEKPIAEEYCQAVEIVQRAEAENRLLVIAENYRRTPLARETRKLIQNNAIGDLSAIHVEFYKHFFDNKPYLTAMKNPLLVDVVIHHLDLLRYFTASEALEVFAHSYNPPNSRFESGGALELLIKMQNGIPFTFVGSFSAIGSETGWLGNWRIEGSKGVLTMKDHNALFYPELEVHYAPQADWNLRGSLDDFITALDTPEFKIETTASDYLKSMALVDAAQRSTQAGCWIQLSLDG